MGVLGRLVLRRGGGSAGRMMLLMSWFEMAAERRCEWPRRPGGGPGAGIGSGTAFDFVGLELMALYRPSRESPPTNSLPPRRCPRRWGVTGASSSAGVSGGVLFGVCLRPEASAALKVKLGKVDTARRCAASPLCEGGGFACIEEGRALSLAGSLRRVGDAGGCLGKENSALGTISIVGPPGIVMAVMLLVCLPWPGATTSAMAAN